MVQLQEVLRRKGNTVRVRRELRQMFPKYECYIAAGSHVDVGNDKNDRMLNEEYARSKAQIARVTFLHKRLFQTTALVCTCHKPRDMSALENMAKGRVLWSEAKTHDNVNRHDLQRQVTYLLIATIDAALMWRRIMGGDFMATLSRHGYAQSTSALYDKVDKYFQDFVHSTHGTNKSNINQSGAHTRRNLLKGSSTSLDYIITWNLTCTSTCTMQSSTSKVHWVGAECSDHALILCTVGGDFPTYRYFKGQVVGGRPGELKLKKIAPNIGGSSSASSQSSASNVITSPLLHFEDARRTRHHARRSPEAPSASGNQQAQSP